MSFKMRALDPLLDEYVFTVKDRAGNQREVMDLIDRLGTTTRAKLGAPKDVKPLAKVAAITTANMRAWDLVVQSRRAHDLARFEEAFTLAEAALTEDPEAPLAKFQMDVATDWRPRRPGWDKKAAREQSLAAVRAVADRLPEKERMLLELDRVFESRRRGKSIRCARRCPPPIRWTRKSCSVTRRIRCYIHFADRDRTVAYIERALQLDPSYAIADVRLGIVLANLGGAEEKLDLLRQRAALATEFWPMVELAAALLTARAEPDAVALVERIRVKTGMPFPHPFLADYWSHTGRPWESERAVRACLTGIDDVPEARRKALHGQCTRILIQSLVAQGRRTGTVPTLEGWKVSSPMHAALTRMRVQVAVGATDSAGATRASSTRWASGTTPTPRQTRLTSSCSAASITRRRPSTPGHARASCGSIWSCPSASIGRSWRSSRNGVRMPRRACARCSTSRVSWARSTMRT